MGPLLKPYIPALFSGIVLALSFPTWHIYPLAWVALIPLFASAWKAAPWAAFLRFMLGGLAFYLVLLQWLMTNLYWAGGWAFWGYVFLSSLLALFWGLIGGLWRMSDRAPATLTLAVLWVSMEYIQSFLFSGFGWGAIAYSQGPDLPLLQLAAVGGAHFISFVIVLFAALAAGAIVEARGRMWRIAALAALLGGSHAGGYAILDAPEFGEEPYHVAVLQPAFPLEMKWDGEYTVDMVANSAEKTRRLRQQAEFDLAVWPESLVMDDVSVPEIERELTSVALDTGAFLFAGSTRTSESGGIYNSSHLITKDGEIDGYYDKIHLAPFGEYVPFGETFPFIAKVVPAIGDIEAGSDVKTFRAGTRTLGPLICFEVIFAPMAERLRDDGADMLAVITNLGWFGHSNAIPQELEIARLRAVETRLPLIHSANTGISGVFDPWGRFSMVNVYFHPSGTDYVLNSLSPGETIANRFGGVLPVALPAERPLGSGPVQFPRAALALSAALLVLRAFLKTRHADSVTATAGQA